MMMGRTLSVGSFYSHQLQARIQQYLVGRRVDCILAFSSAMAEYVRGVSEIPRVMDFVDIDSEKWRLYSEYHSFPLSRLYRLEADRLARYETEVAQTFDHSVVVSEQEARLLKRGVVGRPISVIPNGVDLSYFRASGNGSSASREPNLVFTGAMDYFPNVDAVRYFCREILPLIRKEVSQARFSIVGRNPTRLVKALSRKYDVDVTGAVPDIRPYLNKAMVSVAPLRIARGIQNKVLEAMAMGVPVVGTSTALEGLDVIDDGECLVGDNPSAFADQVVRIMKTEQLWQVLSKRSRMKVERDYSWESKMLHLENVLKALVK